MLSLGVPSRWRFSLCPLKPCGRSSNIKVLSPCPRDGAASRGQTAVLGARCPCRAVIRHMPSMVWSVAQAGEDVCGPAADHAAPAREPRAAPASLCRRPERDGAQQQPAPALGPHPEHTAAEPGGLCALGPGNVTVTARAGHPALSGLPWGPKRSSMPVCGPHAGGLPSVTGLHGHLGRAHAPMHLD